MELETKNLDNHFMKYSQKELEYMLSEHVKKIDALDEEAINKSENRWSRIAKPLKSLGVLEGIITQIAGITGTPDFSLDKKALVIMCADNGVVAEGVTQTGQEVTAVVTANITGGRSCACLMAKRANADVFPVDIGVACDLEQLSGRYPLLNCKIRKGTRNFLKSPAMTRQETLAAILTGIAIVQDLTEKGYTLIATGEMGIGNTTTSSAVASVLMDVAPELVTGRGAGLDSAGLKRKLQVVKAGISRHKPDRRDAIAVLSSVGGLDMAGLTGIFLGGGIYRVPVIIDGFISAIAAETASVICKTAKEYSIASHVSAEPAGRVLLGYMGKKSVIQAEMCLGEGTGAVALMPILDMALSVYLEMSTFLEIEIEDYKAF